MKPITIKSTKYDGSFHRRYEAILLEEAEWGWLTFRKPNQFVESYRGSWESKYSILCWHWRDQWWDAILFFDSAGRWQEWYCNIVTPPRLENGVLRYHDLDLDVILCRERGIFIDDVEEFEENAVKIPYPPEITKMAWENAYRIERMMQQGAWRFGEDPETINLNQELTPWNVPLT
ncbi:MAG: DUF402 domain-containing protein [Ardenticatenaceae bacterium]